VSFGRYALTVIGIVLISLGVLWLPLLGALAPRERWAALAGGALAALNTLAAYALVLWSQRRSTQVFMRAILGGMVGRMALMLAAVVAGILGLGLPTIPLTVSLLGYFVLFLVVELAILQRRTTAQVEHR